MSCLKCPLVVAADHVKIPWALLDAEPALSLLCSDHFKSFVKDRDNQRLHVTREASRMWCPCGREIYLERVPMLCSHCALSIQPTVSVVAGTHPIRVDDEWYRTSTCEGPACESKMVFRLPDGRHLCVAHGAPSKDGAADIAGRS